MGQITDTAKTVYAAGPSSAPFEPNKAEIISLFQIIEAVLSTAINGLVVGNAVVYATRAALFADLAHVAGKLGIVYNDSTPAYNGIYVKAGASGTGSWSITNLALPSTFAADLSAVIAEVTAARSGEVDLAAKVASIDSAIEAVATNLGLVSDAATAHAGDTGNPHNVTKAQVGLAEVDDTSDADKPVSTAQAAAINVEAEARAEADSAIYNAIAAGDDALYTAIADGDMAIAEAVNAADAILAASINATQGYLEDERDERLAQDAAINQHVSELPTMAERLAPLGSAETARLWSFETVGEPASRATVSSSEIVTDSNGKAVRVTGAAVRGPRSVYRIEPGRVYLVRGAFQRRQNPTDPSGDAIRVQAAWLTATKALVPSGGVTTLRNVPALMTASGRQTFEVRISTIAGENVDFIAPSGTVYASLFYQTYGGDAVTDFEFIDVIDQTGQVPVTADITGLTAQVDALESIDAGTRLEAVEAAIDGAEIAQYLTRGAFASATISATVDAVRILQYSLDHAMAPAVYRRVGSAPAHNAYITHPNTSIWSLAEDEAAPEMLGAKGDDITNDRAAFDALSDYCGATGATMVLAREYLIGGVTAIDLSGITIRASSVARLRGNIDLTKPIVCDGLDIRIDSAGIAFGYRLDARYKAPFDHKRERISAGDLVRDVYTKITPINLLKEKIAYPAGTAWEADGLPGVDASIISWDLAVGGVWHTGFVKARGGQELTATFTDGDYDRGAFVRLSDGSYHVFYAGQDTTAVYAKKQPVASASAVEELGKTWPGRDTHESYKSGKSTWTVRVYDDEYWSVLVNGVEVFRPRSAGDGVIVEVGFGVMMSGPALVAGVAHWTLATRKTAYGQPPLKVAVFGDSLSSQFHSGWTDALQKTLDGSFGLRVGSLVNHAVAGQNSLDQLTVMQSVGVSGMDAVYIGVGTNDGQQDSPLSASIANIDEMITIAQSAGAIAIVGILPLWYTVGLSGEGFTTARYGECAELRAAIMELAASRGCEIIDLNQILGPVLADYVTTPDASALRIRDNLHLTAYGYSLVGWEIARTIAAATIRPMTRKVEEKIMPSTAYANGWHGTIQAMRFSVTEDGLVSLYGVLDAGTKTDGTVILQLPKNLAPAQTFRFFGKTSSQADVRLEVSTTGAVSINDMPGGDIYVLPHDMRWQTAG